MRKEAVCEWRKVGASRMEKGEMRKENGLTGGLVYRQLGVIGFLVIKY